MNQPTPGTAKTRSAALRALSAQIASRRWLGAGAVLLILGSAGAWLLMNSREKSTNEKASGPAPTAAVSRPEVNSNAVRLGEVQQRAIGLKTARVTSEQAVDVLTAPGRVVPNEAQYAYITPRAAGVVRSVLAHVGQDVKAGDLLATIDSPQVGEARLDLYTKLQTLEVAKSQAEWQSAVYKNTLELVDRLRKRETPDEIHAAFEKRPVGENREKLLTAYAQFLLGSAKIERNRDLYKQNLITTKYFEEVSADYEVARSSYESLMDEMGYSVRLAQIRAQQALRQAQASVRAAQEHLRILGVKADGTEPDIEAGKVVGAAPSRAAPAGEAAGAFTVDPETILPPNRASSGRTVMASDGATAGALNMLDAPVSNYAIWAPFDGTILDREMIVPGVVVDTAHRIFTLANLSNVWIEASVHESNFATLDRTAGGKVQLRSPAYPGRVFTGSVIYTGDLVEEKSRAIKLLASADNPDRRLKPGMFVEVEILKPGKGTVARVPGSALLNDGSRTFVYVHREPELFVRREIVADPVRGETVTVREGLEPGEEVVVAGAAKLKSLANQPATSRE
jgi:multidrug efflux pump subunit AcrA (membrane-fusion protein)